CYSSLQRAEFSVVSFSPLSCHHIALLLYVSSYLSRRSLQFSPSERNDARGTNESRQAKRGERSRKADVPCVNSLSPSLSTRVVTKRERAEFHETAETGLPQFSLRFSRRSPLLASCCSRNPLSLLSSLPVKLHYNPET